MMTMNMKLIAAIVVAALLALVIGHVAGRMRLADELVAAARDAIGNPELGEGDAALAIRALGADRDELIRLQGQIKGEAALGEERRLVAEKAAKIAVARAQGYAATSAGFEASSRAGGPIPGDCAPSDMVKKQWR